MAIPFYEPREAEPEMLVDQVDGHVNHTPAPAQAALLPNVPNDIAMEEEAQFETPSHTTEQLQAWKTLAVAMCNALKEYYLQTANSENAFTSAVVQILPNGQVKPLWK